MDTNRTRTDDKGEKEFSSLAFEVATILVRVDGYARRRIAWRNGSESIEVKMEREAFLSGEVPLDHGPHLNDLAFLNFLTKFLYLRPQSLNLGTQLPHDIRLAIFRVVISHFRL